MGLIFADGFDNYGVILDLWDFQGSDNSIRQNTGAARTGIGCLQINSAAFGPTKTFNSTSTPLCCTNWNSDTPGIVMAFCNFLADIGQNSWILLAAANTDGSITVKRGPTGLSAVLGTSAAGKVQFNVYNNICMQVFIHPTLGTVTVWCNGAVVLALTGQNTTHPEGGGNICDGIQLMGPGGIPTCYHDDVYMFDCTTTPNNTFVGALKLYALAPTANAAVVWTPNAGTNWSNVSEVPPDGDTSYNSSSNVGDQDQYVYPATGVPSNSSIFFVQHEQDLKIGAAGSRSVGSVINGAAPQSSIALTSNYHIYPAPYDNQPGGSNPWTLANFPINAGPKVTL
jgi:hypothetical protein